MDPALAAEEAHRKAEQKTLNEARLKGDSIVAKFYDDATIFITGGSGFLGKSLVEKLLRVCKIKKIYYLLREKNGKTPEVRLKEIFSDPLYDLLRQEQPNFITKIVPIRGDSRELNLGLTVENWQTLANEVNVIFHVAATINFQEKIQKATEINVRGTQEILRLARNCNLLRSVVHVSTAFSHATESRIKQTVDEDFYDVPISPESLVKMAENNEVDYLNEIFQKHNSEWPNTYSFTKAVAEEAVRKMEVDLPICIVRPAIVISAYREPSPGWVDTNNVFGPSGLVLGIMIGIIHAMMVDLGNNMDLVPVDVVSNALITAGWETARTFEASTYRKPRIYAVTNTRNNLTYSYIKYEMNNVARELISPHTFWYYFVVSTRSKPVYLVLHLFLHAVPAFFVQSVLCILRQKPKFLNMYKKVGSFSNNFTHFWINDWIFEDSNTKNLYDSLSSTDKELFNFDMTRVHQKKLITVWVLGIRRYIIKDGLTGTLYGRRKQFWLKIIHYASLGVFLYVLFKLFCFVLPRCALDFLSMLF